VRLGFENMKILVLGAGRMGHGAVFDLVRNSPGVERVTVADFDLKKAEEVSEQTDPSKVTPHHVDASSISDVANLMKSHDAVISCVNYWYNVGLTKAAIQTETHFCDLGGNNYVVDEQLALDDRAEKAGISVIPDCGLAPGMVSILAAHGAKRFDSVDDIRLRVGGLPQNPVPPLDYQLIFSVEGLINEYIEVARVIRDGKVVEVESMTELESLSFDGFPPLEAFQTSGGTSTLPDTFLGKVENLDYKTIRYAGHCDKFKTMIDLGLCSSEPIDVSGHGVVPRKVFADLLTRNLPADGPDYVLVRVEVSGKKDGSDRHVRFDIVDRMDEENGLSAMMRTTAFPASIMAQMMVKGEVSRRGAVPQELAIDSDRFVEELGKRGIELQVTSDRKV
jgi:lysine 6-dehydrogenase